jgi:hypothetical protein
MSKRETPCPPEPETIAHAAATTLDSRQSVETVSSTLDRVRSGTDEHRRLAHDYAERLADAVRSEEWFRDCMVGYGRYLRGHGVSPEHIVICVRHALGHTRLRQYSEERHLANRALGWAIAGYYEER